MRKPPKHIASRVDKAKELWVGLDDRGWYWWITINENVDGTVSVWGDADHDSAGFCYGEDNIGAARRAVKDRLYGRKCERMGNWPDSAGFRQEEAPDPAAWVQESLF